MKKIIVFMLSFIMVFAIALPVMANEPTTEVNKPEQVEPRYLGMGEFAISRATKSGNTVYASAYTQGKSSIATKSYVRVDLYRRASSNDGFVLYKSGVTNCNTSGGYVDTDEVWSVVSGYTYKIISTHTVYVGTTKETYTLSHTF